MPTIQRVRQGILNDAKFLSFFIKERLCLQRKSELMSIVIIWEIKIN